MGGSNPSANASSSSAQAPAPQLTTSTSSNQLINVTVNLQALQNVIHNQSVPIFVGIVASFILMALLLVMAFVMKGFMTTFLIPGIGCLVLFVSFVLTYFDGVQRKNDIQNKMDVAQTNMYASAVALDCPMYFEHQYNSANATYTCLNINGIGELATANTTTTKQYATSIPIDDTSHLYPYEEAYVTVAPS